MLSDSNLPITFLEVWKTIRKINVTVKTLNVHHVEFSTYLIVNSVSKILLHANLCLDRQFFLVIINFYRFSRLPFVATFPERRSKTVREYRRS